MLTTDDIAKMIDHSLLKPNLSDQDIIDGCKLADEYNTITVCVRPTDVPLAVEVLKDSEVKVGTVIGFPHGSNKTEIKVLEAREAIKDGAEELDMVLNIGKLLSEEYDYVEEDIRAVVEAGHAEGKIVKVILENCYLTDELIKKGSELCEKAGADYVKTSTGYGSGGATVEDLKLMRASVSDKVKIKAAGGVRTLDAALSVRALGATRFGATATKTILDDACKAEEEGQLEPKDPEEIKEIKSK